MKTLWAMLAVLITACVVIAQGTSLRLLADVRGIRIGAAIQPRRLTEADYAQTLSREFNLVTPENDMKFGPIHPEQGTYNFTNADAIVDFAVANRIQIKGHTLAWHSQQPAWVTNGSWTREQLMAVLHDHIMTVVGRYKGRIAYWDVVNEAIDDGQGNKPRETVWSRNIGPDYIEMAFRWAHEADPGAKLLYNDYGTEGLSNKSNAAFALVQELVRKGVPIDGVGLQSHFVLANPPKIADIALNVARLNALGLFVHFSELDIRIQNPVSDEKLEQQAELYKSITQTCVAAAKCMGITTWGFTDKYSWITSRYPGSGAALLFDNLYASKPSYRAIAAALVRAP